MVVRITVETTGDFLPQAIADDGALIREVQIRYTDSNPIKCEGVFRGPPVWFEPDENTGPFLYSSIWV